MTSEIISVICGGKGPELPGDPIYTRIENTDNSRTPCQCYQDAFEARLPPWAELRLPLMVPEIIIYVHDDVRIDDPEWLPKVLALFENPKCVVVGLGGATELGREGLYKRPYRITDMARGNYASAQRDWKTHGSLLEGAKQVATVDAFFMACRTSFLQEIGGWPVAHISHHCLDLALACEAARHGKEVWAVGIDCMHYGGGSSTKPVYREAKWLQGGTLVSDHEEPHKWLWKEFRDVLPIMVPR